MTFIRTQITPELASLTQAYLRAEEVANNNVRQLARGDAMERASRELEQAALSGRPNALQAAIGRMRAVHVARVTDITAFEVWVEEARSAIEGLRAAIEALAPDRRSKESIARSFRGISGYGMAYAYSEGYEPPFPSPGTFAYHSAGRWPDLPGRVEMINVVAAAALLQQLQTKFKLVTDSMPRRPGYGETPLDMRSLADQADQLIASLRQTN